MMPSILLCVNFLPITALFIPCELLGIFVNDMGTHYWMLQTMRKVFFETFFVYVNHTQNMTNLVNYKMKKLMWLQSITNNQKTVISWIYQTDYSIRPVCKLFYKQNCHVLVAAVAVLF